jgi:hypothetical protein
MNKPLTGVVAGAGLGFLDGLTAWFTPAVRDQMAGILIGSSLKGVLVGVAAALLARRVNSMAAGVGFAAALGLGLAYAVASFPQPDGTHYWAEIMIPGFITGGLIGFITQRY